MAERSYAAVDLGAESGRVVLGRIRGDRASLEVVHRFANEPVRLPDGLHWNLVGLFGAALAGLKAVAARSPLDGVGVDAWGVDYGLLDEHNRLLGLPFHYRDERTRGMIDRALSRVGREELYGVTGMQLIPINTVYQLLADEGSRALAAAERVAFVPDLLNLWLTGELVNEATVASTSGLLDARDGTWARPIIDKLGLPSAPFAVDPVEPGRVLGTLSEDHAVGSGVPVHLVAGHDTASGFAAAPIGGVRAAVISSGTWSLLGVETAAPVLTEQACAANLTNERGVDGTTRLLANVMGLWIVQECRRHWASAGEPSDYDELHRLAAAAPADVPLFDPDADSLLAPGDMPARIAAACRATRQRVPAGPGETIRSALVSLACKYRLVLERLERATGQDIEVVHVIGGGSRNSLLCELTADLLGRLVLAGPTEATALGNVLMQARASGELASASEMRAVALASAQPVPYEPTADRSGAEDIYQRFLAIVDQVPRTAAWATA